MYAQIQTKLLTHVRKPGPALHDYRDEIVAVSQTANITKTQRSELVHTAKREEATTIEAALAVAEDYEDEYGSNAEYHIIHVAINTQDSTENHTGCGAD